MQAIYIFSGETALSHSLTKVLQSPFKKCNRSFPGGQIPGWRTKVPYAARMQSKTNKKESLTNS